MERVSTVASIVLDDSAMPGTVEEAAESDEKPMSSGSELAAAVGLFVPDKVLEQISIEGSRGDSGKASPLVGVADSHASEDREQLMQGVIQQLRSQLSLETDATADRPQVVPMPTAVASHPGAMNPFPLPDSVLSDSAPATRKSRTSSGAAENRRSAQDRRSAWMPSERTAATLSQPLPSLERRLAYTMPGLCTDVPIVSNWRNVRIRQESFSFSGRSDRRA